MIVVQYLPERDCITITGIAAPFPAGSLELRRMGDLFAVAAPHQNTLICAWAPYTLWTRPDGSGFASGDDAAAYLTAATTAQRAPQTVPVAITVAGQTAILVSPMPSDVNSIVMLVNGIGYRAPSSFTFSAATCLLTWFGSFNLIPDDEVVLLYS